MKQTLIFDMVKNMNTTERIAFIACLQDHIKEAEYNANNNWKWLKFESEIFIQLLVKFTKQNIIYNMQGSPKLDNSFLFFAEFDTKLFDCTELTS